MHRSRLTHAPLALALAAALGMPAAQAADAARWVHGSWVNVRATAAADGAVTAHVTTNTQVALVGQQGNTCEIAWGKDTHGFIACKMLGEDKVKLEDAMREGSNTYSPPRAFWMAPSADALFDAGRYFQQTLLSKDQNDTEQGLNYESGKPAPKLVRYAVPEFDAMKAVLAGGIVSARERELPALASSCTAPGHGKRPPASQDANWDCYEPALPQVRPSYFKRADQVFFGSADVDALSHRFGIKEFGKAVGGPKWESLGDGNGARYVGAWDIGRYQLRLAQPMVEHTVGRTGLVSAIAWSPIQTVAPFLSEYSCGTPEIRRAENGKPLADYPVVDDELMHFQVPAALPFRHAKITVHRHKLQHTEGSESAITGDYPANANEYLIDLDGDGVPDVLFVEGTASTGEYGSVMMSKTYANIAGAWVPVDQRQDQECT